MASKATRVDSKADVRVSKAARANKAGKASKPAALKVDKAKVVVPAWARAASRVASKAARVAVPAWATRATRADKAAAVATANRKAIRLDRSSRRIVDQNLFYLLLFSLFHFLLFLFSINCILPKPHFKP